MNKPKILKHTLFVFLILVSLNSYSQLKTHFGYTIGGNLSQLNGDNENNSRNIFRTSMFGGLFLDVFIEYHSYIEFGCFYSQQGGVKKLEYNDIIRRVDYKIKNNVDYIMFPVIWKQQWGDLFTQIGGYGEIAINANSIWQQDYHYLDSVSRTTGIYKSFTHDLRMYDVGAVFGIGYQSAITYKYDFFINLSYKFGFFPIENNPEDSVDIMKNRFFTLNIGLILFNKEKRYARKKRR